MDAGGIGYRRYYGFWADLVGSEGALTEKKTNKTRTKIAAVIPSGEMDLKQGPGRTDTSDISLCAVRPLRYFSIPVVYFRLLLMFMWLWTLLFVLALRTP